MAEATVAGAALVEERDTGAEAAIAVVTGGEVVTARGGSQKWTRGGPALGGDLRGLASEALVRKTGRNRAQRYGFVLIPAIRI
jgi:hypothetical protein